MWLFQVCEDTTFPSVSIHTPTQGVTWRNDYGAGFKCFNPHTHAGCDHMRLSHHQTLTVSIHTPTQGVTCSHRQHHPYRQFQSTHPRRVWLIARVNSGEMILFQSTHPRRVWHILILKIVVVSSFNPHTHAGCDHLTQIFCVRQTSFNPHTHAGCDTTKNIYFKGYIVSIHTPTQGVT